MTRVIMHGCNGKMGRVISELIESDAEIEIVAGVDVYTQSEQSYPVFEKMELCDRDADVIIDFASASAIDDLLEYSIAKQVPCVLCTTGLSEAQLKEVEKASKKVAILKSANMSLGINLLMKLLKSATSILQPAGYDIEVVEKHHNQKLDAPSGTAIALADAMKEEIEEPFEYTYDRSQVREPRKKNEIGMSAIRGGTIVGEHDIIFAGIDEVITFSHTAYSRAVFGKGAIQAGKYLKGKPAGYYTMSDVIEGV
ncbi:MAG: 4-hydroxy-tetrahydrodipicolinate reductase [Eubacteriales bacterium]